MTCIRFDFDPDFPTDKQEAFLADFRQFEKEN